MQIILMRLINMRRGETFPASSKKSEKHTSWKSYLPPPYSANGAK